MKIRILRTKSLRGCYAKPLTLGTFDPCKTKMLAMYSGVGPGKFPPSNAGNQLACATTP